MNSTSEKYHTPKALTVQSVYDIAGGTVTSTITEDNFIEGGTSHSVARGKNTFSDGERSIDFVLVWDEDYSSCSEESAFQKRSVFEKNLEEEGLELEYEPKSPNGSLTYIKIHAPLEVLRRYSEILKLRMPMRKVNLFMRQNAGFWDTLNRASNSVLEKFIFVNKLIFPDRTKRFTAIYSRDKEYLFDIKSPNFFTQAVKSRIVQFILDRSLFATPTTNDMFVFGIERLLSEGVYTAAYPLHDGDLDSVGTLRQTLYKEWASIRKWYRYQPVDYIREYFGVKIGLYFTWLGFYTHMLFPAALVGLLCFFYSWSTLPYNLPSNDICKSEVEVKMCPLCDNFCDYWNLSETCLHSKVTYLFDNNTTVFFAVFMSVWGGT